MVIESVKLVKTVKCGSKLWVRGSIVPAPIPQPLLNELRLKTGTVEVFKEGVEVAPSTKVEEPIADGTIDSSLISKPKLVRKIKTK